MNEYRVFDEPTWTSDSNYYCPVKFIPGSMLCVSGGCDGSIKIWDIDNSACQQHLTGHNQHVWSLDVTPCGRYIVAGDSGTKNVELYSQTRHLYSYQGHSDYPNCAAFSPCGKLIVSGGLNDNMILAWVNWPKLADEGAIQNGGDWATKQYARVNHDGASIAGKVTTALKG